MTLPFIGTGGVFTRFGVLGRAGIDLAVFGAGTLTTDLNNILAQYTVDQGVISTISAQKDAIRSGISSSTAQYQAAAAAGLNLAVYLDNPLFSRSNIIASINELIRQMKLNAQTVKQCTITATVAAAPGVTNVGNGVVVTSIKRADGLIQENSFAEVENIICTADGQPGGGARAGNETWQWKGEVAAPSVWDWQWPLGSGATQSFTTINAASYVDSFNDLRNGDFENFTVANVPDNWVIAVGLAGTQVLKSTTTVYAGSSSLQFAGDGVTLTAVTQTFNVASNGSSFIPLPEQQFAVNGWVRLSAVPAAGVFEVALVDGSGTITTDAQGVANSFTLSLPAQSANVWINVNGVFRTPNQMPATLKLRLRLSTALSNGVNFFMDQFAMGPMTLLYTGGPSLSIFAGSINWIAGGAYPTPDTWRLTVTNNRAGASNQATHQTNTDRLLNMRANDLLLPSTTGAPTISDSLI